MLLSYLRIALRSLIKHRVYSLINILGLAVGLAACMLLLLYIIDEYSYDDHHPDVDRTYRLVRHIHNPDGGSSLSMGIVSPEIAPQLEADFPEIENAVRVFYGGIWLAAVEERWLETEEFMFAEADVFDVLSIPLTAGDPEHALVEPFTTVLSASYARVLFGDENPLGESIRLDNEYDVKVTGVYEDLPLTTQWPTDLIVSFGTLETMWPQHFEGQFWGYNSYLTFVKLREGSDPAALEAQFPAFVNRHKAIAEQSEQRGVRPSDVTSIGLQRIDHVHMNSEFDNDVGRMGNAGYTMLFLGISIGILIVACVNFMNLATARSSQRAREIGLRKVIGANRSSLVGQFLGESFLITGVALLLAVILLELWIPYMMDLLQQPQGQPLLTDPLVYLVLGGMWIAVTLLAGAYPAFYLSGYKPARILRGELTRGVRGAGIRRTLVVGQFAVSVGLLITMGVSSAQMRYMQDADLGFVTRDIYQINAWPPRMKVEWPQIKQRLLADPAVMNATMCNFSPGTGINDIEYMDAEVNGERIRVPEGVKPVAVDPNYFDTFEIERVAGRTFQEHVASDSSRAFVLNATAVRVAGWSSPQEALGAEIDLGGYRSGTVVGVVRDTHHEPLHREIKPMIYFVQTDRFNLLSVRATPGADERVIDLLEDIYATYWAGWPFRYMSLDDRIEKTYRGETVVSTLFTWCAVFATFIACLGLLGLAAFTAERRAREIGIRKTLGASNPSIVMLLVREFVLLVGLAILIAWPISWLLMDHWLDQFIYRIELRHDMFIAAAVLALAVAVFTVATQAVRAASVHPVRAIRVES